MTNPVNDETRTRITKAANELLKKSEDGRLPTVEEVRALSKASMNAVAVVMREWRGDLRERAKTAQIELPIALQEVFRNACSEIWEASQKQSNETLNAALEKFERERTDWEELSQQQADAFEAKEVEIQELRNETHKKLKALESEKAKFEKENLELKERLAEIRGELEAIKRMNNELLERLPKQEPVKTKSK